MNQTYQNQITRISGYTSTNHKLYNSYLYDTLKLPISINNRVAQIDQNHLFYLKLMSVDSIVSKKKIEGYQKVDEINGLKLYQSTVCNLSLMRQINFIVKTNFKN